MAQLELNEPIQVLVDFRPSTSLRIGSSAIRTKPTQVIPRVFIWQNHRYFIQSLNLVHKERQGEATVYYFSVSTDTNTYKLSFHNTTLEWHLVEVWSD